MTDTPAWDRISLFVIAIPLLLPWPFGPHVAGEIKLITRFCPRGEGFQGAAVVVATINRAL